MHGYMCSRPTGGHFPCDRTVRPLEKRRFWVYVLSPTELSSRNQVLGRVLPFLVLSLGVFLNENWEWRDPVKEQTRKWNLSILDTSVDIQLRWFCPPTQGSGRKLPCSPTGRANFNCHWRKKDKSEIPISRGKGHSQFNWVPLRTNVE